MKPMGSSHNHNPTGFTLVELLVTLSIIGLLAGVSIVTYARNWRAERVKAASRETAAWLDEVRRIAIQKATPCRIRVDRDRRELSLDPNPQNSAEFCGADLYAPLQLSAKVQNSQELLLCSADIGDSDPATMPLSCSQPQPGSSSVVVTPRGTAPSGLLLKFHMPQAGADRCVALLAPLGQVRAGKTFSSGCHYTSSF